MAGINFLTLTGDISVDDMLGSLVETLARWRQAVNDSSITSIKTDITIFFITLLLIYGGCTLYYYRLNDISIALLNFNIAIPKRRDPISHYTNIRKKSIHQSISCNFYQNKKSLLESLDTGSILTLHKTLSYTTILFRRHPNMTLKIFSKEGLRREVQLITNLLDGHIGRF